MTSIKPQFFAKPEARFFGLCLAFLVYQLAIVIFSPFGLSADEAHYWDWSRSLALSYYSKGPVLAWLIYFSTKIFGDSELAIRLPALLCSVLFSIIFYLAAKRVSSSSIALVAWIALRSFLIFATLGMVMTSDAPLAFFWVAALWAALAAIDCPNPKFWLLFGAMCGLAVLAKYTALILYPAAFLFLLCTPSERWHLRTFWFWSGALLFFCSLAPVLIWNSENGWVNFLHNAGHLQGSAAFAFRPKFFFELLGGQLGLAGPLTFFAVCFGVFRGWRSWRSGDSVSGLLLFVTGSLLFFCFAVSSYKRVYANWPMPLYIGGVLLLARLTFTESLPESFARLRRRALTLNFSIVFVASILLLGIPLGIPGKFLPTKKLAGWPGLGALAGEQLQVLSGLSSAEPFVMSASYDVSAALSYYMPGKPRAYCANFGRRMNQYDIWDGLEDLAGRNALLVLKSPQDRQSAKQLFDRFEELAPQPTFEAKINGDVVREFYLARGYGFHPERRETAKSY